jgi:hypothetical protein
MSGVPSFPPVWMLVTTKRVAEKQLASLVRRDALCAFLRVCDEKTVFDETHTELP